MSVVFPRLDASSAMRRVVEAVVAFRRVAERHAPAWLATAGGTVVHALIVTNGTSGFTVPDGKFTLYYDALGDSLLQGRFDVPRDVIGPEAYWIGGHWYGYFGPTPALFRIVLDALVPGMRGHWTRTLLVAYAAIDLIAAYGIYLFAREAVRGDVRSPSGRTDALLAAGFLLTVALGSTLPFIDHSPILYHEASSAGAMCALVSFYCLLRYRARGQLRWLLAAFASALLSFQARGSVGAGPMLAIALTAALLVGSVLRDAIGDRAAVSDPASVLPHLSTRGYRMHALTIVLVAGVATGLVLWKNERVLGNVFGSPPLDRHVVVMNDPARLAITGGRFIQPRNLRTTLYNYLNPAFVHIGARYPFVSPRSDAEVMTFPETRLDHTEAYASLTAVEPFWCVLAILGTVMAFGRWRGRRSALGRFRVVIAGGLVGSLGIMMCACITERYLHDTFPVLVTAPAAGLAAVTDAYRRAPIVRLAVPILALLAVYTCAASVLLALGMARW